MEIAFHNYQKKIEREKMKIVFHEYQKKIAPDDRLPRGSFFKGKRGLNVKVYTNPDEFAEISGGAALAAWKDREYICVSDVQISVV